jgi:hypothetical protein
MNWWKNTALLALGLALTTGALAEGTNVEKEHSVKVEISTDREIPQDVRDKLTTEQIFELEKIKAAQTDEIPALVPLIVAIVFACPVALIGVILYYRHRRNRMLHQTIAAMIDKGTPIPPELLQPERSPERPRDDLRGGLVLVGVGLGLIFFFLAMHNNVWGVGFIPLMIGVGRLIAWKLAPKNGNS